ncbi:DUF3311 domain-containing protein [Bacillus subtilis]|jgi:hypothetical protein|uniref:Uncharacterized membrane protein YoyD n=5 Tax=Bacillus subtilis TaxID=1423 RepID=YOYD_BACSU|nr:MULTISPECIES: DUF3311 domain-containing protein [Bacillales]YP_003097742.1 putative exported protein [Bacillus subtilis subsp. subtilis str. 168]C0H431.1 RecName: Full=Uncharacterized membrane protein YoyD [Bacillus subtilis subsp. subtilis str. 168]AOL29905.1 hypothetical protein BGM20_04375 [Alkalicoccobacillus gibsonii]AXC53221.1 DUF3311 domain-containing protein [Bacillus spizizenii]MBW4824746.1 DUF3311 domain-containing protein [Bacillaceae bacterium]MDP4113626.1 DUF3311 domain-contai
MVKKALIVILILLPFVQLALLPLVNRIEPIMFGLPFFHFWLLLWIIVTPLCSFGIYQMQKKDGGLE